MSKFEIGTIIYSEVSHKFEGKDWGHTTGEIVKIEGDILTIKCKHGFCPGVITYETINERDAVLHWELDRLNGMTKIINKESRREREISEFWESCEDGYDNPKG